MSFGSELLPTLARVRTVPGQQGEQGRDWRASSGQPGSGGASSLTFAVRRILLPEPQHGRDLDGNGSIDNQFRALVRAVVPAVIDLQSSLDASLAGGAATLLLRLDLTDPDIEADQRVSITASVSTTATASSPPAVNPTVASGTLGGRLRNRRFTGDAPVIASDVDSCTLPLPLFPTNPFVVRLRPAIMDFTIVLGGSALRDGRLAGAATPAPFARSFAVGLSHGLTSFIHSHPGAPDAVPIAALFDTGGCINPDGTSSRAGDGVIDPCELLGNPLFAALAAADVGLFDETGTFAPSPDRPKDRLSVGIGFEASVVAVSPDHH